MFVSSNSSTLEIWSGNQYMVNIDKILRCQYWVIVDKSLLIQYLYQVMLQHWYMIWIPYLADKWYKNFNCPPEMFTCPDNNYIDTTPLHLNKAN